MMALDGVSVINAGDGSQSHPTQALLDALTLLQEFGDLGSLRILIAGDLNHSRVAKSNIAMLKKLGAGEIRLAAPEMLMPNPDVRIGTRCFNNLDDALEGVDVVMMLRIQTERMGESDCLDPRTYHKHWCFNSRHAALAEEDFVILHPGPMNRGMEITDEFADGPHSLISRQVANGVFVRMAIISTLLQ